MFSGMVQVWDLPESVSSNLVTKDFCVLCGNSQPWSVLYFHLSKRISVVPSLARETFLVVFLESVMIIVGP